MLLHLSQQPLQSVYALDDARAAVARADRIRAGASPGRACMRAS
jgi:hypothetical protein